MQRELFLNVVPRTPYSAERMHIHNYNKTRRCNVKLKPVLHIYNVYIDSYTYIRLHCTYRGKISIQSAQFAIRSITTYNNYVNLFVIQQGLRKSLAAWGKTSHFEKLHNMKLFIVASQYRKHQHRNVFGDAKKNVKHNNPSEHHYGLIIR